VPARRPAGRLAAARRGALVSAVFTAAIGPGSRALAQELQFVETVFGGAEHTCALQGQDSADQGRVLCWGANGSGQLGNGSTSDSAVPIRVAGLGYAYLMSAGGAHSCAITAISATTTAVSCWGYGGLGQLGSGSLADSATPIEVSGAGSGVITVAAGGASTCVGGGGVVCVGANDSGQLGDGSTTGSAAPVPVAGLPAGELYAVALSALDPLATAPGTGHACALATIGRVLRCWGANGSGQLGDGTTAERHVPAPVSGISEVIAIATGARHTCAVTEGWEGTTAVYAVRCWGANDRGQLGDGTTVDRSTPVPVSGLTGPARPRGLAAGARHTCAVLGDGSVRCWGANEAGQLGDGSLLDSWIPVVVSSLADATGGIGAGGQHTCAAVAGGQLRCWGANGRGQLGDGTTLDRLTPVPVLAGEGRPPPPPPGFPPSWSKSPPRPPPQLPPEPPESPQACIGLEVWCGNSGTPCCGSMQCFPTPFADRGICCHAIETIPFMCRY
jgi:alpha-tubulin suppressor-like RCC1 family protein